MVESERENTSVQLQPGEIVAARYRIVRPLGIGGMGSVYLAQDQVLSDEEMAIKILHPDFARDQRHTQRFLREVQLMHRVNHKNVVRTFDVGTDGPLVYFTMEYVPGFSLSDVLRTKAFPQNQLANILIQICEGLDAIHAAGIVHRDLKPGNIILLKDGTLKITDFGVARPEKSDLTAHNEIIGSASFMAPEIWLGKKLTYSVDLYSLGIVAYSLVTGRLPFDAEAPAALMRMHVDRSPLPPKEINRSLEPWMNKLILSLLAKQPQDRPQSGRAVIDYIQDHTQPTRQKNDFRSADAYAVSQPFIALLEERSQQAVKGSTGTTDGATRPASTFLGWLTNGALRSLLFHRLFDRFIYSEHFVSLQRMLLPSLLSTIITILLFTAAFVTGEFALNALFEPVFAEPLDPRVAGVPFLLINGIPPAVLFLLQLSLPCAAICAFGGSVRSAASGGALAGVILLVGGFVSATSVLLPAVQQENVDGLFILSAVQAVKSQLAFISIFSPLVPSFTFSAEEQGLTVSGPILVRWYTQSAIYLPYLAYLFTVNWLAAGAASLTKIKRLISFVIFFVFSVIAMLISGRLAGQESAMDLVLFGIKLPWTALYAAATIACLLGISTFGRSALNRSKYY